MNIWRMLKIGKMPTLSDPILIEGLPGIGNVGKIAVDFLIEELKAKKCCEFTSYAFPHSVFVNEKNLVELPSISLYYKKRRGKPDILFLAGDVQPIDEASCYEFSDLLLDTLSDFGGKTVVTLGGIGLKDIPENPQVYVTGCEKKHVNAFIKGTKATNELYGTVGPIVGVTGILLGLAGKRKLNAVTVLAETFGHPTYLGLKGAKEMLAVLKKKFDLGINLKRMEKEIIIIENEIRKRSAEMHELLDLPQMQETQEEGKERSYIG